MIDSTALKLLNELAALQRRHSGGVLLLTANRTRVWVDSQEGVKMEVDSGALRRLVDEGLVLLEPYSEKRPRGVQILGMTSRGWRMAEPAGGPGRERRRAA